VARRQAVRREIAAARVRPRAKSTFREWTEAIVMAVVLVVLIRTFMFQAFRIPSGSMLDTLQIGDFLFVNKMVYGARVPFTHDARIPGFRKPHTGDIIVFRFPLEPKVDYIKRVIASEGQTVRIVNKKVYVDGTPLVEPYTKYTDPQIHPAAQDVRDNYGPITVPANKLFCMGDNRDNSWDSRYWGYVPYANVKGKAFILYWSWDSSKHLPRFDRLFHLVH
jgi:signal peptidase I